MADYHSLLMRAVANLPSAGTPATRQAIYGRARKALLEQLRSLRPPLPESDIGREETRARCGDRPNRGGASGRKKTVRRPWRPRRRQGRPALSRRARRPPPRRRLRRSPRRRMRRLSPLLSNAPARPRRRMRRLSPRLSSAPPPRAEWPLDAGRSHCVRRLAARPLPDGAAKPAGAVAKRACPIRRPAAAFAGGAGSRPAGAERNPSTPNSARGQARRRRPSGRRLQSAGTARACRHSRETAAAGRRRRRPARPRPWSRRRTPRRKVRRRRRRLT